MFCEICHASNAKPMDPERHPMALCPLCTAAVHRRYADATQYGNSAVPHDRTALALDLKTTWQVTGQRS